MGGGGEGGLKISFRPYWPQFGIKIGGGGFAQRFPGVFHIVLVRYEAAVLGKKWKKLTEILKSAQTEMVHFI